MATKTKLGDHFYLWRGRGFTSGVCIVSSHGGQTRTGDNFTSSLHIGFYQTRNESLRASLNTGLSHPNERVPPNTFCEDYFLSKFQGKHGDKDEDYNAIKRFVDGNNAAVLTVRNRTNIFVKGKGNVKFSDALKKIEGGGYGISSIHCLFCRVPTRVEYVPSSFLQAQGIKRIVR